MNPWPELTKTAVLGTRRAAPPELVVDDALADLLAGLDAAAPAHRLLSQAGAVDLIERVGRVQNPLERVEVVEPAADERPCSPQAAAYLAMMLAGRYEELLPEFLRALAATGRSVPPEWTPNLLAFGIKKPPHRPEVVAVLGERGRWLAAQKPTWFYASAAAMTWDDAIVAWQKASASDRQTLLRHYRQTQPALGRQLLESTWKAEQPLARLTALRRLEQGLDMADEPFLESVLDDRHAGVRKKAAELLASLPASRLCGRMTETAPAFLNWRPGEDAPLAVSFPAAIAPSLQRDGVPVQSKKQLAHLRADQLTQVVSAVPLDHWTETWQISIDDILLALPASRWPRTLTGAFSKAAQWQGNAVWARALLHRLGLIPATRPLISLLPPDELMALLAAQAPGPDLGEKNHPLILVFDKWPHAWTADMTRLFLDALLRHVAHVDEERPLFTSLRRLLRRFAAAAPPALADEAAHTLQPLLAAEKYGAALQESLAILQFRRNMLATVKRDA